MVDNGEQTDIRCGRGKMRFHSDGYQQHGAQGVQPVQSSAGKSTQRTSRSLRKI